MNEQSIILITKDALCKDYLPIYGNKYWKGQTPNIDELASKGTIFNCHYTAAPSTVMAFRSMMFGTFAHEQPYADYIPMEVPQEESYFFPYAKSLGFECHLLWDKIWVRMVLRYGNMFGPDVIIHNVDGINQGVGPHTKATNKPKRNDEIARNSIQIIEDEVDKICKSEKKVFLWIHLPHVIRGRIGYGDDMDLFDDIIGMLRKYFQDDNIFISADHGNMDGYHNKYVYGFDVYTPAVEIPLITPKIDSLSEYNGLTSNVDIKALIFNRSITQRDVVFSDCAYYAQPHRKLAIISNEFSYIFNKHKKREELYDLRYDRYQRSNLISDHFFDTDRKLDTLTKDVYFSPRWEEAQDSRDYFRTIRDQVWKNPPWYIEIRGRLLAFAKMVFVKIRKLILGR